LQKGKPRGQVSTENLLEEAQKDIFEIALERDTSNVVNIKDVVRNVFNQFKEKGDILLDCLLV